MSREPNVPLEKITFLIEQNTPLNLFSPRPVFIGSIEGAERRRVGSKWIEGGGSLQEVDTTQQQSNLGEGIARRIGWDVHSCAVEQFRHKRFEPAQKELAQLHHTRLVLTLGCGYAGGCRNTAS